MAYNISFLFVVLQIQKLIRTHPMISIFIWLLLVGALESKTIRNRRADTCSWKGHCAGDPCSTYNDCDGSLTCLNGKCGDGTSTSGNNGQSDTCKQSGVLHGST
jgi:hypothetical protein